MTAALDIDLKAQKVELVELHIDRAYLSSEWVKQRDDNLQIFCKAWPVRNGELFEKTAFILDWDKWEIKCPNQITIPFAPAKVVKFPPQECTICPLQQRCTTSKTSRSISIHPDEALMQELRELRSTVAGRAALRQRSTVEHTLAHVGQWQGDQGYKDSRQIRSAVYLDLPLRTDMPRLTADRICLRLPLGSLCRSTQEPV